jgi:putative FmdB family regulatory protein
LTGRGGRTIDIAPRRETAPREDPVPLYEYRCPSCGKTFEKIQKFSANRKARCPECGASGKKLLSAPAIQFKGTGWYVTDYARKGKAEKSEEKPTDDKPAGEKPEKEPKKEAKKDSSKKKKD